MCLIIFLLLDYLTLTFISYTMIFVAAMAGLRFGDQILQINGNTVAGWDTDKTMAFLKKASPEKITFAVRDR